jgi:rhodanese-related sulfurtransferase/CBS domain-containing protein
MSRVLKIGYEDVQQLMEDGAQIIDVLPPGDYDSAHLPGAMNLPLQDLDDDALDRLDRFRPIVVYCADNECDLSPRAAARLAAEGFPEVYDYVAGLADWSARGLSIEGEDADLARAGRLMQGDLPTCDLDDTLMDIADRFGSHTVCAVTDGDGVLLGRIWKQDAGVNGGRTARDVMHPGPSTFRPDVPIEEIYDWFQRGDIGAFIVTALDGRPLGVLYRSDVERLVEGARERHAEHANA